jgi:predicted enzyme related to lactoylglutathione lyase
MLKRIGLINYPVTDLVAAKAWYRKTLGIAPYMDTEMYVGFQLEDFRIGLNPTGYNEGMQGPVIFWEVEDINKSYAELIEAGATVSREPQEMGPQLLASLIGGDGTMFGLIQSL